MPGDKSGPLRRSSTRTSSARFFFSSRADPTPVSAALRIVCGGTDSLCRQPIANEVLERKGDEGRASGIWTVNGVVGRGKKPGLRAGRKGPTEGNPDPGRDRELPGGAVSPTVPTVA